MPVPLRKLRGRRIWAYVGGPGGGGKFWGGVGGPRNSSWWWQSGCPARGLGDPCFFDCLQKTHQALGSPTFDPKYTWTKEATPAMATYVEYHQHLLADRLTNCAENVFPQYQQVLAKLVMDLDAGLKVRCQPGLRQPGPGQSLLSVVPSGASAIPHRNRVCALFQGRLARPCSLYGL